MNFYRRFIEKFFCIAVGLTSMLRDSENVLNKKQTLQISEFLISETQLSFYKLI